MYILFNLATLLFPSSLVRCELVSGWTVIPLIINLVLVDLMHSKQCNQYCLCEQYEVMNLCLFMPSNMLNSHTVSEYTFLYRSLNYFYVFLMNEDQIQKSEVKSDRIFFYLFTFELTKFCLSCVFERTIIEGLQFEISIIWFDDHRGDSQQKSHVVT